MFFNILFMFVFCCLCLFSLLCILWFGIVLCVVSRLLLSFSYFVLVYRPLPPGRNPIAVNKYYIMCHIRRRATCAGSVEKMLLFTTVTPTQKISCAVMIK
jgi:hypothetical protein